MTGVELIAAERNRQIHVKGWTDEHDDQYKNGELSLGARCYMSSRAGTVFIDHPPSSWPWDRSA